MTQLLSMRLFSQPNPSKLNITHLKGDFYVYTTWSLYKNSPVPSNSMYVVTTDGVVMLDTPWDSTQFQPLLDSIEKKHHQKVVLCISTHFHEDRTGGVDFLKQKGIKTFSSKMTYDLCGERNERQPQYYFINDTVFTVGNHKFMAYYPGEGHSKDNIVILFNHEKIIYGGCFVKSTENSSLGNIADANLSAWPESIKKLIRKFPRPKYVIPGHSNWENNKSLEHTLKLLKENNNRNIH
jgi:metallo-beta-lactamase class B